MVQEALSLNATQIAIKHLKLEAYCLLRQHGGETMGAHRQLQIDSMHCRAICEEIGERLRIVLARESANLPDRLRSLMDQFAEQEFDLAPSIAPSQDAGYNSAPSHTDRTMKIFETPVQTTVSASARSFHGRRDRAPRIAPPDPEAANRNHELPATSVLCQTTLI